MGNCPIFLYIALIPMLMGFRLSFLRPWGNVLVSLEYKRITAPCAKEAPLQHSSNPSNVKLILVCIGGLVSYFSHFWCLMFPTWPLIWFICQVFLCSPFYRWISFMSSVPTIYFMSGVPHLTTQLVSCLVFPTWLLNQFYVQCSPLDLSILFNTFWSILWVYCNQL